MENTKNITYKGYLLKKIKSPIYQIDWLWSVENPEGERIGKTLYKEQAIDLIEVSYDPVEYRKGSYSSDVGELSGYLEDFQEFEWNEINSNIMNKIDLNGDSFFSTVLTEETQLFFRYWKRGEDIHYEEITEQKWEEEVDKETPYEYEYYQNILEFLESIFETQKQKQIFNIKNVSFLDKNTQFLFSVLFGGLDE